MLDQAPDPIRDLTIRRIDADLRFLSVVMKTAAGICDTADYLICAGSKLVPVAGWKHTSHTAINEKGQALLSSVPITLWGEEAKGRHLWDLEHGRKA